MSFNCLFFCKNNCLLYVLNLNNQNGAVAFSLQSCYITVTYYFKYLIYYDTFTKNQ